jgi:hypothetical protein
MYWRGWLSSIALVSIFALAEPSQAQVYWQEYPPTGGLQFGSIAAAGTELWGTTLPKGVYRWNGSSWTRKSTLGALEISISPDGRPWILTSESRPARWNGSSFEVLGGECFSNIAAALNDSAWATDCNSDSLWNKNILQWVPSTRTWQQVAGKARWVGVASNGRPWVFRSFSTGGDRTYERVSGAWVSRGSPASELWRIAGGFTFDWDGKSFYTYGTNGWQFYVGALPYYPMRNWAKGPSTLYAVSTDLRLWSTAVIR